MKISGPKLGKRKECTDDFISSYLTFLSLNVDLGRGGVENGGSGFGGFGGDFGGVRGSRSRGDDDRPSYRGRGGSRGRGGRGGFSRGG